MSAMKIKPATMADAIYIGEHLRAADVTELRACQPDEPSVAVVRSFVAADWCNVVTVDEVPAVIYGVTKTNIEGVGSPWMLATDDIGKICARFLIGSKREVERMRESYDWLYNKVHCDNAVSIKWLRWLGFEIYPDPCGADGKFLEFLMRPKDV
jgi:hypothetical protein